MIARLGVLSPLLGLVLAGAAPSDLMLCLHRDGRAFVEPFQELCCTSPCPTEACGDEPCGGGKPSDCPDEGCRDCPLALTAENPVQNPSPLGVEPPSSTTFVEAPPAVPEAPVRSGSRPESGVLDPPGSWGLALLRTVLLRP